MDAMKAFLTLFIERILGQGALLEKYRVECRGPLERDRVVGCRSLLVSSSNGSKVLWSPSCRDSSGCTS